MQRTAVYFGYKNQPSSEAVLKIIQSNFKMIFSQEYGFKEAVDQDQLAQHKPDFIFSFGPTILKTALLHSAKVAAINFHTAPPEWPGRGSCSFALLQGDKEFGVTAHLMTEEIDAGAILKVLSFPIEAHDTADSLHKKTLDYIPQLVQATVDDLIKNNYSINPLKTPWTKKALRHKDLMSEMEIKVTDSKAVVERKIKAFVHPTKPGPYVMIHGKKFWYLAEENK
jgi:methionyl-tRNA formyltransferase